MSPLCAAAIAAVMVWNCLLAPTVSTVITAAVSCGEREEASHDAFYGQPRNSLSTYDFLLQQTHPYLWYRSCRVLGSDKPCRFTASAVGFGLTFLDTPTLEAAHYPLDVFR